ncbi:hypothetical protein VPNG_00909 [Cytospora leucostoma]|uniref:Polyprenal reductase n=1 Tax=Cytospora leucostoma TaxID=1230097 RepID=A0A423XLR3_9PEZI|nr:hypothetical protein VPNG_00909 [Cytospora leucostoma]
MEHWSEAVELLLSVSPARWCQICFTLATCAVLGVAIAPPAERKLLVNYGARGHDSAATSADKEPTRCEDVFLRAVRKLTSLGQVPHSWFGTFYLVYIQCALFWAIQYITRGFVLQSIANQQVESGSISANGIQVVIAWCLMLFQAARRLYESWAFAKPSKSTMWIVHWLLGQFFYLGISVAIWLEGSDAILHDKVLSNARGLPADALFKIVVALPLFIFAWVSQYRCHKYLAGLKKYSLPDLGMFRHLVCPHYTCECVIYLSLAIVAAPEGQLCNTTLLSALIFVAVNLGVTAHGTRSWYTEKFGPEKVAGRRILIPLLY